VTALAALIGARVRRIDAPSHDLWAITVAAAPARGTLLVSLQPSAAGVGWVERRPHGQPATGLVQKLRRELEGGRLQGFGEATNRIELLISRGEDRARLVFDFTSRTVRVEAGDSLALGPAEHWPESLEVLAARGAALLESRGSALFAARRGVLAKAVANARKRLARRLQAVAGDAARAAEAPVLRGRAQLLLGNLHALARGAASARVLDYSLDPPAEVEIALDPTRSPREQAEAWFKQARRFERGAALSAQRKATSEAELEVLEALARDIAGCEEPSALDALAARAEQLNVHTELPEREVAEKTRGPQRHAPYRMFRGHAGRTILVGKGAADNDTLTREHARPQDLWLHARDRTGAHVVVPLERGEVCSAELLVDAAMLAAHYSDARSEAVVDVSYTPRRYVRKPKGAAVGMVIVEREKVMRVMMEADRLAALLKTLRE
jgi:predicted ribosome quality control (RQC) complex YloA/Tae2 family protein